MSRAFTEKARDPDCGLDRTFRLYDYVLSVDGATGGKLREWGIEPGSLVGDMIHVTDLYTTFARIAGTTDGIPRDRLVDGSRLEAQTRQESEQPILDRAAARGAGGERGRGHTRDHGGSPARMVAGKLVRRR